MKKFVIVSVDTRDTDTENPVYGIRGFDTVEAAEAEMWDRFKADLDAQDICEIKVNGDTVLSVDGSSEFPLEQWNRYKDMPITEAIKMHGHGTPLALWSIDVVCYAGNGAYEGIFHKIEEV
jgi:hypothetical protein